MGRVHHISLIVMTSLAFTLSQPWKKEAAGRLSGLSGLSPEERTFLLSPDSMTEALERQFGARVRAEVIVSGLTPLPEETAGFLGSGAGEKALERGVWLTAGKLRLVYAHSLIPAASVDEGLFEILKEMDSEPIGRVLESNNITFTKERIEVGLVSCPQTALGLAMDKDTTFFARRYILIGAKEGAPKKGPSIRAAIMEIFSPGVISTGSIST